MNLRKHGYTPAPVRRRQMGFAVAPKFAPESHADFPAVPDDKIAEVRRNVAERFGFGTGVWEVVEDVAR